MNPNQLAQQALQLQQQGQLEQAAAAWKAILKRDSRHLPALANLASLHTRAGRTGQAMKLFKQALKIERRSPELWFNYANLLNREQRTDEAAKCYRNAIKLNPELAPVWYNLGVLLLGQGELKEAETCFSTSIRLAPDFGRAYRSYADLLVESGRPADALEQYQIAQLKDPSDPLTYRGLGNTLADNKQYEDAIEAFQAGLSWEPGSERFLAPLAELSTLIGNEQQAMSYWQQLLSVEPEHTAAHMGLGKLMYRNRQSNEMTLQAVEHLKTAWQATPGSLESGSLLGFSLAETGFLGEARSIADTLVKAHPDMAIAHILFSFVAVQQARIEEGLSGYQRALEIDPHDRTAIGNACISSLYSDELKADELTDLHKDLSARLGRPGAHQQDLVTEPTDGRRIRVGYLSADFRAHPVGYFLEPLLENHDHDRFEVFGYGLRAQLDDTGQKLVEQLDVYRECARLDDESLLRQIHEDRIDILIDTGGHTADARSSVIVHRAAPVQALYLGYPCTSGLENMDYCIGDASLMSEGSDSLYSETPIRLGSSFLCFKPRTGTPEVVSPPSQNNNFITFGSFNNYAKVSDSCVSTWAEILKQVPHSRLLLKSQQMIDTVTAEQARQRFTAHGIDPERIITEGPTTPVSNYLAEWGRVDIALDSFPYNGGTTSCDALWMGVPVISLAGSHFHQRMGASILKTIGLAHWVAQDAEDYAEKAISFAFDLGRLDEARKTLRKRMTESPLCDASRFTANFEKLLDKMIADSPAHRSA